MKRNLSLAAVILFALLLGMAIGYSLAKEPTRKVVSTAPDPIDRRQGFAEDGRRIQRNGLHLHLIYQCQINWLAAHPHSTLPENSAEACTNTDEILTKWNEANEANP